MRGLLYGDVYWSEQHRCLAIWQLRPDEKTWIVRTPLLDAEGMPRQVTREDLEEAEREMYDARNNFDKHWYKRTVEEHNRKVEEASRRQLLDDRAQIAKEAEERRQRGHCWHGLNPDSCKTCAYGSKLAAEARQEKERARRFAAQAKVAARKRRRSHSKSTTAADRGYVTTDNRRAF